jgi:hydroxymethylpyrimidine/phosphomethylpyrimidine kinase
LQGVVYHLCEANLTHPIPVVLTIAGSDSGAGAGIQADLKTFAAHEVYGTSVVTAVTAQNTRAVTAVEVLDISLVLSQLEAVLEDFAVVAIKTGMLPNKSIIHGVSDHLASRGIPLVVDPVMVATSGDRLVEEDAVTAIREQLLPLATLATPNLEEAAVLLQGKVASSLHEMEQQAMQLYDKFRIPFLLKGGHLVSISSADILVTAAGTTLFQFEKIDTRNTHGTGCTLSAAITATLARGNPLEESVAAGLNFVHNALHDADRFLIGEGHGPVHHFYKYW